jgi:hypothetical protein
VKYKATLPLLLLLVVAGQLSAVFCIAQCEGMSTRMMAHACGMHGMAQGHYCASCKHSSVNDASGNLSAVDCSGQICNSVLGLVQKNPDHGFKPLVAQVSIDAIAPPVLGGMRPLDFKNSRCARSIPPFDPLISSLRV